jgi:hypothetical protein
VSSLSTAKEIPPAPPALLGLKPGELVRVRSSAEIFATLDDRGMFDGLPVMPEMLKYCGRTLPVTQRAGERVAVRPTSGLLGGKLADVSPRTDTLECPSVRVVLLGFCLTA